MTLETFSNLWPHFLDASMGFDPSGSGVLMRAKAKQYSIRMENTVM